MSVKSNWVSIFWVLRFFSNWVSTAKIIWPYKLCRLYWYITYIIRFESNKGTQCSKIFDWWWWVMFHYKEAIYIVCLSVWRRRLQSSIPSEGCPKGWLKETKQKASLQREGLFEITPFANPSGQGAVSRPKNRPSKVPLIRTLRTPLLRSKSGLLWSDGNIVTGNFKK